MKVLVGTPQRKKKFVPVIAGQGANKFSVAVRVAEKFFSYDTVETIFWCYGYTVNIAVRHMAHNKKSAVTHLITGFSRNLGIWICTVRIFFPLTSAFSFAALLRHVQAPPGIWHFGSVVRISGFVGF